jgi:hypothetical protein
MEGGRDMKVYLIIIEDRHVDVEVEVYATAKAALDRARWIVARYDYTPEEPDEEIAGWLYHATLSREGDCLRVAEAKVR